MLLNIFSRLQESVPGEASTSGAATPAPSLEDTIGAQFDRLMAGDTETADEPENDAGQSSDADANPGRARDAAGKFAKPSSDSGKAGDTEQASETDSTQQPPADAPEPVASKFAEPPKSWTAEEKADWAKLPENYRAAAHRREENFFKGIEQYRGKAQNFDSLHAVIAPHADIFKQSGQNAVENIGGLLDLQRSLYSGDDATKIGTLLQIATNVGIQPQVLIEALQNPQSQPAQDPRYDTLARETQQLREMLGQIQIAPLQSQVQQFFADPKNEHLGEPGLKDSMLGLIQSGVAKTVQEAYDKACRLSDTVQAKVTAQKAEADRKAQAERDAAEAKRKADLAAKATRASSINVRPRGVTTGQPAKKGTLEDTIGATFDAIAARNG